MDKFKKYLVILDKYQFWIICGLMLVTVIACWWLATGSLAGQFAERKTKLDQAFSSIKLPPNPPNQGVIDKIHQQHDVLKRNVFDAWEILYREQKENNPLPNVLSEDFKQQFENLKPKDEELKAAYREQYQNFISAYLPTLKRMIDARRLASSDVRPAAAAAAGGNKAPSGPVRPEPKPAAGPAPAAGGPGNSSPAAPAPDAGGEEWIGTVDWTNTSYNALVHQFEWPETPSTLAVLLAQEDLWVYEALLRMIKNSNEGATGYATAAVKRIDALEIGKNAAKGWKDTDSNFLSVASAAGASAASPSTAPPASAASGEERNRQELIEGRYVDSKGSPLPYDSAYPYAKHSYAEFKMMPIRMLLVMDQRRLPKLLVECANSTMPIEVQRIYFVKGQGGAVAGGTGSGGASDATAAGNREGGGSQPPSDVREAGPSDISVEIRGVIYIYNSPDRAKLGTGTASTEKPAETPPPVAPTTPAPAAPAAAPSKPAPATAPAAPSTPAPAAPPATAPAATPAAPPATAPAKPSKP